MDSWPIPGARLRSMYAGGHAGASARRLPRRRWRRWILASVAAAAVIAVAAVAAFIKLGPSAAAMRLPHGPVSAPVGQLVGNWRVAAGSLAGFRVQESALGLSSYVGGQTAAVTGTVAISGATVTAARFQINLTTIRLGGKTQPQFAASLGTRDHPAATFTLSRPVTLGHAFTAGSTITVTAAGELAMNGSVHPVTVTLLARRNGARLQTAGSIPVMFARWDISRPGGLGFLGSLASHGDADFVLTLRRR